MATTKLNNLNKYITLLNFDNISKINNMFKMIKSIKCEVKCL